MITQEELKKIAALAKLYVEDGELATLAADLSDIVAFADSISEIEVADSDELSGFSLDSLREDSVMPSLPSDSLLQNARHKDSGFFVAEVRRHE